MTIARTPRLLLLIPIVLASGCRASDVPSILPTAAPQRESSVPWNKPRVSVGNTEPQANLVVRLYEVRHSALRELNEKVGLRSVLEPQTVEPSFGRGEFVFQRLKSGDDFLSRLALWCRAESHPVRLLKTLEISSKPGSDQFVWDAAPTDREPTFGGIEFSAEPLGEGRVQLRIHTLPAKQFSAVATDDVPWDHHFTSGFEIEPDEILAVGGLTINRSMAPEWEKKRFRLITIAQETVELMALVSVVPREADADHVKQVRAVVRSPGGAPLQ